MITGIILAGGDKQRINGESKSLLPWAGEKLIHGQIREMNRVCNEIIIVTDNPRPFLRVVDSSVRIITDFIPGKGILSGMHAGLTLMENECAWVVACDMPYISVEAAAYMKNFKEDFNLDAVVPKIGGRLEMLHGLYSKSVADSVRSLLNTGEQRAEQLLHFLKWSEVDADQFVVMNIDTKFTYAIKNRDDYQKLITDELHPTRDTTSSM
jgi:molybdenum cofactor guanylyltransferase